MNLTHHFGAGVYIKETVIPAGKTFAQHKHKHDHLSALCKGWAEVTVDGVTTQYRGAKVLNIAAGKVHTVKALTEVVWLCIHATDETDVDKVDHELIE